MVDVKIECFKVNTNHLAEKLASQLEEKKPYTVHFYKYDLLYKSNTKIFNTFLIIKGRE